MIPKPANHTLFCYDDAIYLCGIGRIKKHIPFVDQSNVVVDKSTTLMCKSDIE
jgi:hypothetical protein